MNEKQLRKLHTLIHATASHCINVHMRELHVGTVSTSAVDKTLQAMYDAERAVLATIDNLATICPPVPNAIDYEALFKAERLENVSLRSNIRDCQSAFEQQRNRIDKLEQRNARQAEVIGTRDKELDEANAQIKELTQLHTNQRDTIETLDKTIAGLRYAVNVLEGRIRNAMQQLHNGPKP